MPSVYYARYNIILPEIRMDKVCVPSGEQSIPSSFQPRTIAGFDACQVIPVTTKSAIVLQNSLMYCARYLSREMGFQVNYTPKHELDTAKAYLWIASQHGGYHQAVGGCCFQHRRYSDVPDRMALQWVWIHPYARRKGFLSQIWPYFKELYGDFTTESSYPTMCAFLRKHDFGFMGDYLRQFKDQHTGS